MMFWVPDIRHYRYRMDGHTDAPRWAERLVRW